MPPNRDAVLVTSLPDQERSIAEDAMRDAIFTPASLTQGLAGEHADPRILAIPYSEHPSPGVLEALPRLKAVITRSDGHDNLPEAWLKDRGIAAYHLGDYAVEPVAHFTLALVLGLLRRIPEAATRTRGASWSREGLQGRSIRDVTVGVLGTGRIGREAARLLNGLGARVVGYDLTPDPDLERRLTGFRYAPDLPSLLRESDALTVHVPLTEGTRGMIGERELLTLPERAVLVNTARGAIVDQAAVERALESGRLGGYAADVLPGEPRPTKDLERFRRFPNVLLTPHVAAYDERTIRARYERTARIAEAVLSGDESSVEKWRIA